MTKSTTGYKRKSSKKSSATSTTARKSSVDSLYESKAGEIIKAMEDRMAEGKFNLRWNATPCNFSSKRKYNNMNLLLIAFAQMFEEKPFESKYWLTLKQANNLGYRINKDSSATYIVCWFKSKYEKEELDESGQKVMVKKEGRLIPRAVPIYNLEQTNAPKETEATTLKTPSFTENLNILKTMLEKTGVDLEQGGDSAHYSPLRHAIKMPFFQHFIGDTQQIREMLYLTTLAHELAHSTMKSLRPEHYHPFVNTNALEPVSKFLYAKEEVVAEITAAMLCATLQIEKQILPDHFAYVRGWLELAKQESPLYFSTACKLACEAHDFLMSQVDDAYTSSDQEEEIAETA